MSHYGYVSVAVYHGNLNRSATNCMRSNKHSVTLVVMVYMTLLYIVGSQMPVTSGSPGICKLSLSQDILNQRSGGEEQELYFKELLMSYSIVC